MKVEKMLVKNILCSIDIIETTIRNDLQSDVKSCNDIISAEIIRIIHNKPDNYVADLIFSVYHNWKVYSGQMNGYRFNFTSNRELEYMITDCNHIKLYLSKLLKSESG